MEVQTQSAENEMNYFDKVKDAFEHARKDKTVWKISFEGVRLIRVYTEHHDTDIWIYSPMSDVIEKVKKEVKKDGSGIKKTRSE